MSASSSASPKGSFVNGPRVVCAVRRNRSNGVRDLLKQSRDRGAIMCPTSRQIRCDDLTCIGIDGEVRLPPSPSLWRVLHMTDVDSESCTVDEQVDRLVLGEPAKLNVVELLQAPRQGGVIRWLEPATRRAQKWKARP